MDIDVASTYGVTTWGDVLSFEFRACGNYIVHGDGPAGVPGVSGLDAMQFLPSKELAKVLGLPFVS